MRLKTILFIILTILTTNISSGSHLEINISANLKIINNVNNITIITPFNNIGDLSQNSNISIQFNNLKGKNKITIINPGNGNISLNVVSERKISFYEDKNLYHKESYLRFYNRIDSSNEIKELSDKLKTRGFYNNLFNVLNWSYHNLEISNTTMKSSELMQTRKGSLDSINALLISILRNLGYYSRFVYGFCYFNGLLNPCSWAEVYNDGWIGIDWANAEVGFLDGAHVKLADSPEAFNSIFIIKGNKGNAELKNINFSAKIIPDNKKIIDFDSNILYKNIRKNSYNLLQINIENNNSFPYFTLINLRSKDLDFEKNKVFIMAKPNSKKYFNIVFSVKNFSKDIKTIYIKEKNRFLRENINLMFISTENGFFFNKKEILNLISKNVYIIPQEKSNQRIIKALKGVIDENTRKALINNYNESKNALSITRLTYVQDNKTIIKTIINPIRSIKNLTIYEEIPKCLAEKISEIYNTNKDIKVLKDDPLIMWDMGNTTQPLEINITFLKAINDTNCLDNAITTMVAKEIGEKLYKKETKPTYWAILAGIGIIALMFLKNNILRRYKKDEI